MRAPTHPHPHDPDARPAPVRPEQERVAEMADMIQELYHLTHRLTARVDMLEREARLNRERRTI